MNIDLGQNSEGLSDEYKVVFAYIIRNYSQKWIIKLYDHVIYISCSLNTWIKTSGKSRPH
jgi:hypothetical protein